MIGQEVMRNINIPEAELQKYYDEHKTEFCARKRRSSSARS